ncbi:DUF397 domain-containing protein [Sphaerimonospora thailandensis]|uniref:DUF397 domain-containing protein n=1 Tax=Sphaerimonospora thailandensis TaxID=795644 RepID=UPI00194EDF8A|nr:DUF397 domain-containing protein [Sphaerimonospora thailandensis]
MNDLSENSTSAAVGCARQQFAHEGLRQAAVRDSKDRSSPVPAFTPSEWSAFIAGAKQGEFRVSSTSDRRSTRLAPTAHRGPRPPASPPPSPTVPGLQVQRSRASKRVVPMGGRPSSQRRSRV